MKRVKLLVREGDTGNFSLGIKVLPPFPIVEEGGNSL